MISGLLLRSYGSKVRSLVSGESDAGGSDKHRHGHIKRVVRILKERRGRRGCPKIGDPDIVPQIVGSLL